jgi:hypothetical protein
MIGTLARKHNEPVKSADARVRGSYLRSDLLELRAKMMRWWDSINALKAGKALLRVRTDNVVRISARAPLKHIKRVLTPVKQESITIVEL